MEQDILKMYDVVFKDMVDCYLENYNQDLEEYQKYREITEEEKQHIAYRLIYKSEYLWDVINDTIEIELQDILKEKETE